MTILNLIPGAYATYPTDSKSGAAMDRIEGSADAGDAATFMFTFATNKVGTH